MIKAKKIIVDFINYLIASRLDNEYILVRKERLYQVTRMVNNLPESKIATLSLIRLDGCSLEEAKKIKDGLNTY